jgi:hypothetical protein
MPISSDLLQAKQTLSSRLLTAGFRGDVVFRGRTLAVAAAVASAGRNVHAVGVGSKMVGGKATSQQCVRLYVVQKLALSLLPPRDRLPESVNGIPTDIIEAPPAFASVQSRRKQTLVRLAASGRSASTVLAAGAPGGPPACTAQRQAQQRPVIAGISAANHDITAGTLGYFCRSTRQGDNPSQVCVLSNNHIFANLNRAQVGDALYQPGPADGGVAADHFAGFLRCVPLQLDGTSPNRIDGAIGNLIPGLNASLEVCSIGKIAGTARAIENMAIRKHGRTTGYTEGTVTDELIDALVAMDPDNPKAVALFQNQFRVVPSAAFPAIGKGGDSGSLVVKQDTAEAVGLYFANPPTGEYGYANHIADVLHDLEIELL